MKMRVCVCVCVCVLHYRDEGAGTDQMEGIMFVWRGK
jgi:hypothetical protein